LNFLLPKSRFPSRFFRFAFLVVLAAGLMAPAVRVSAQAADASPQPAATQGSAAKPGTPPAESNSEDAQLNAFLHSSAIQGLAKFLHLSMATTDDIFLALNYLIIFLVILIPLGRFMPRVMRKRTQNLRHNLDSARKLTEEATARLNAVEAQLAKLGDEIDKFRSEVEGELKNDEARIKGAIEEESARIVASAEQEISMAAVQARRGLRKFAAELAVDHAARQLELSPEADRALVAEFAANINQRHNRSVGGHN
jgi:F-type H+-transporting ATPase subunit b